MPGGKAPRILIVDDHPLFREALVSAISQATGDTAETLSCGTLDDAQAQLADRSADLILLDLTLGDTSGFDGIIRLNAQAPDIPVAIVSATETEDAFRRARSLGACGFLPKSLPLQSLRDALDRLLSGDDWFPESQSASSQTDASAERIASLTPAQRRVLDGVSDGLLNKQIAFEMGISEATVKAHMTAIFRKLGVHNRTQALLALKAASALDITPAK